MDLEPVVLSELRERQIAYNIAYMWNLKERIQMNLFTEQTQSQEGHSWLPGDKGGEG